MVDMADAVFIQILRAKSAMPTISDNMSELKLRKSKQTVLYCYSLPSVQPINICTDILL